MYFWTLAFLAVSTLYAADEAQLALVVKAQSDFDRVELSPAPQLRDTFACIQSQAALLTVAPREEAPMIHFRKGYCSVVQAVLKNNSSDFSAAAAEFAKAVETWPDRVRPGKDRAAPEPVSSGLRALAVIARLEAGEDAAARERDRNELAMAIESHSCTASLMPPALCEAALRTGSEWLGWIALQQDDLYAAARILSRAGGEGAWWSWAAGKQAMRDRNYPEAVAQFRRAVDLWDAAAARKAPPLMDRLKPQPRTPEALVELGGAQILTHDYAGAIATLSAAAKADPGYPRAFYLRARARELAGDREAALSDYNLAARAAFAGAKDLASGEAHLYRGISLYLRKDFEHAEDEFASALNFDIPASMKSDADAWRHLAAVAGGACASREPLERSLETASPFFPKEDARKVSWACTVTTTSRAPGSTNAK